MIAAAAVDDDDEKKPREEEEHTKEIERKETPTSHSTFQKRPIVLAEDKEDGYYTHTKKKLIKFDRTRLRERMVGQAIGRKPQERKKVEWEETTRVFWWWKWCR